MHNVRPVRVYLDESSTDSGGPVAVVAGLLMDWNGFAWLDIEWEKALAACGLECIHMRTYQKDLKGISKADRVKLFTKLTNAIHTNKSWSLEAMIDTQQHKKHFGWLGDEQWSMYATCFLLTALQVGKQLMAEKYPFELPYILDDGNAYRAQVERAHKHLAEEFQPAIPLGSLDFGSDATSRHLQAADVVAWTVRRKRAGDPFRDYLEPLETIFTKNHVDVRFKPEWMAEISEQMKKQRDDED